jgi:transcriptional regulator with XRE-family HTH domain
LGTCSRRKAIRGTWARNATFGGMLRRLRESAGLTQEELAARSGMAAKGVRPWERGERKRSYFHTVRSLAEALDLPEGERAWPQRTRAGPLGTAADERVGQPARRLRMGDPQRLGGKDRGRVLGFVDVLVVEREPARGPPPYGRGAGRGARPARPLQRQVSGAKARSDGASWEQAWAEGRVMSPDETVAYALGGN